MSAPLRTHSAFLALSCVGFVASALPAHAQEEPKTLGGVTVTDTAVDDEIKVEKAESPKYVRPLLDTPQTITVISNTTLKQQNLLSLRDALSTIPGITFGAGEGGGGYGDSINLRGQSLTSTGDIQIDGVRDAAQYSRTDTFNIEQIEVVNGANSVYGGSGSTSGTINLVTKRPKGDNLTVAQAGIGTDNYYRATIDSNLRLSDLIAVRLNAVYHENDIPGRDFDSNERWGVAPAITIGIDGPTSLTLLYTHQKDDNTPQYGVFYYDNAFYDGPLPGISDSGYYGFKNVDYQKQTVDQATVILAHAFNERVSLRNLARWQRVEQNLVVDPPQGPNICLADGTTPTGTACAAGQAPGTYRPGGPRGNARFTENQSLFNQLDVTFRFGPESEHVLNVGASYLKEDYTLDGGNVLRNPGGATPNPALDEIDLYDPDPVYTGPVNFVRNRHDDGDATNKAVYAFGAFKLFEQLELNAGVRYENARQTFRQDSIATPATGGAYTAGLPQSSDDDLFSYRAGLVYKPVPTVSLYAAYGNARNPTSTSTRAGCGVTGDATFGVDPCSGKPEKTVNYEVGVKADLFDARLQLTAALFRNERTNFRVTANDPLVGTAQVPDGRSRVDGIALGATGNITPEWAIFANYTYLDSKVKQSISDFCRENPGEVTSLPGGATATCPTFDAQAGNPLTNTPKHSGSLFTTYTLPFGLQIGYGLTYQGSVWLNNAQNAAGNAVFYKADDYLIHRAFASYAFGNGLTAQLNVQNFTNERYFTSIRNNGWALPGEDRSAVLSLFYSF
ncbi:TonB-dependent receptor [Sphingosinicella microcystinivorans]|uniref:TonB-dependent receptor n=1 Tax=Sphingosinicella microcystinivorans TaxID=335406 RepID=UPI0022F37FC7|nr:TonB-dependent siderophore receptor [Sphingosinicella microcystinivorans]WBX83177.1 TonB-dependent siderophore receptor [Sphingosinicella microcystinivorans]